MQICLPLLLLKLFIFNINIGPDIDFNHYTMPTWRSIKLYERIYLTFFLKNKIKQTTPSYFDEKYSFLKTP
jgi:hypothetical protein